MITKHKDFHTTSDFWECDCKDSYIHSAKEEECKICGELEAVATEARVEEILEKTNAWSKLTREKRR